MVGLPDKVLKIVGLTAGDIAVLQRVLQMSLAAVDAVHMEACAGQLQRVLAAQQTQTHYEITFCFIKHLLPPRMEIVILFIAAAQDFVRRILLQRERPLRR